MRNYFEPALQAHLTEDDLGRVRHIQHSQEFWFASATQPGKAAHEYLLKMADVYQIPAAQLAHAQTLASYSQPLKAGGEYRLAEVKSMFDTSTYSYVQTYLNVPVWGAGLSVTVRQNPTRVTASACTNLEGVKARLPAKRALQRHASLVLWSEQRGKGGEEGGAAEADAWLREILGDAGQPSGPGGRRTKSGRLDPKPHLNAARFYIYRYFALMRLAPQPKVEKSKLRGIETDDISPVLPLPPVPAAFKDGQDYLVTELLFNLTTREGRFTWRALVEVETNTILYLRALVAGVNGLVFTYDPITSTGVLTNTADQSNAVLNPLRDDVVLNDLNGPVGGIQSLTGTQVTLVDEDAPTVAAPTEPVGDDFDYDARTNDFAAVNAYYHVNNIFDLIADLGFSLATYFDGTTFPVHVDHRASFGTTDGIEVNAYCGSDAEGDGIGRVGFCLGDLNDPATHPLGRSVDKWVSWHEVGGHGILFDHVRSGFFGFSHSAGDGLAALQNDPESGLRGVAERFRYAPFRAGMDRWFNRDVTAGWGFGGSKDDASYQTEQILATAHFRIYRALGGDAADIPKRWFASRAVTYLILRAVGNLTQATNPANAQAWVDQLYTADDGDWTSEGYAGGAYGKVIRWAFEKQGLYQPAGHVGLVTQAGDPPAVDVYIDDGRHGEYEYKWDHWNNTSMWNRTHADAGTSHEKAIEGVTNYMYVKVKNRGTQASGVVTVKGYHCLPGAGLTWPTDFTQMTPLAGLTTPGIDPDDTEEVTLGPFEWVPNANVYGHDCVLMIATTAGDPSNIDKLGPGETIEEWRLVPHDNNVGQRNIMLIGAGEGAEGLMREIDGRLFFVGNPFRREVRIDLNVHMPPVLMRKEWRLEFKGVEQGRMVLKPGEKRKVEMRLTAGKDFTAAELKKGGDWDISVRMYANHMLIGGMTYRLEPGGKPAAMPCPDLKVVVPVRIHEAVKAVKPGARLKRVVVKKVTLELEFEEDREE